MIWRVIRRTVPTMCCANITAFVNLQTLSLWWQVTVSFDGCTNTLAWQAHPPKRRIQPKVRGFLRSNMRRDRLNKYPTLVTDMPDALLLFLIRGYPQLHLAVASVPHSSVVCYWAWYTYRRRGRGGYQMMMKMENYNIRRFERKRVKNSHNWLFSQRSRTTWPVRYVIVG